MSLFKSEPVLVLAAVQSALALVAAFGLHLSPEQMATVVAFSAALLGLVARRKVSPAQS